MATLRRYFVAGLLVWIPLGITLWVLKLLVDMMDQSLLLLPAEYQNYSLWGGGVDRRPPHRHAAARGRGDPRRGADLGLRPDHAQHHVRFFPHRPALRDD